MITLLAINWASVGLQAGQLILSLSILVIIHELGHYLTAKWFKCRVEKFYLFFDPWFSLFKKKVGETEYGIGWLPLGGYVKIAGMIDESMDKEQMKKPAEPWEFRSKPAWQRLIIMVAGVTMNILLAFLIYSMILLVWGEKKVPVNSMKYGLAFRDSLMFDLGFKNGDKILAVNDQPVDDYTDIVKKLILGNNVSIERAGKPETVTLPVDLIGKLVEKKRSRMPLLEPRIPVVVNEVADSSNAYKAGLQSGDQIIAINGASAVFFDELKNALEKHKDQTVQVNVLRGADTLSLPTAVTSDGTIGFYPVSTISDLDSMGVLKLQITKYSVLEAFPAGVKMAGDQLQFYIDQFKKILSPETGAYKGVGGFKAMGSIFPDSGWDWETFWRITAFFSIVLAFMNLLPIPALDGGHVMFTLYEMISGRKPSDKFLEYAQIAGMIILFGLLIYANGNDWFGWGRGK
ncbi:RIP metalloprotease RseP [Agriterribacter sp.]|uniref:RIP metalloprotease RseP n=1 Tax=Agriterribacter sp. TaxID=2821509 RepID=UPI002CB55C08|nr:RIP metalloprotease RseP [Agriterribacter sp.]HRO46946.1 RIP metalloprotease RseP [Agriterribacter sp.]HRQ19003.1 RIP metalloprotease RseP [Agriterribacter sp.]